ncbi:MAG: hypothetical protein ACD_81C00063G0001, partial [uncultured bacterium]
MIGVFLSLGLPLGLLLVLQVLNQQYLRCSKSPHTEMENATVNLLLFLNPIFAIGQQMQGQCLSHIVIRFPVVFPASYFLIVRDISLKRYCYLYNNILTALAVSILYFLCPCVAPSS